MPKHVIDGNDEVGNHFLIGPFDSALAAQTWAGTHLRGDIEWEVRELLDPATQEDGRT